AMTWFLPEEAPEQVAPLATRPASNYWERVAAGYTAQRIEDDSYNRAEVVALDYERELSDTLPSLGPEIRRSAAGQRPAPGMPQALPTAARRARLYARANAAIAQNPALAGTLPTTDEEFSAQVQERRQREYDEARAVLEAAPSDAFMAETLGRIGAGTTDEVALATLPLSVLGGPAAGVLKTIGAEVAINAGSELAIAPRRQRVADELDMPEPNILADVAMAGLTAGAISGAGSLIGRGAARYSASRIERQLATDTARPAGVSPGRHEGRVSEAVTAMEEGRDPPAPARAGLPEIPANAPGNWGAIRGGIFAGESGGDFNALFGFSNREGGPFANVKLTEMTVDQALEFAAPGGRYANWVKARIGRVATPMGAYQIVGTTLRAAKKGLGLKGDELMSEDLQEQLGIWIFRAQGTGAWEGYRGPRADFEPGAAQPYAGGDFRTYRPTERGYTGEGQLSVGERRIDVEYQVVDASLLRKAEGRFQPRDRSRINSDAWIADTAARLDPAQLMPSPTADRGAPLIGPDDMIESGNGRFSAIQRAYDEHPDRAAAYRRQIEAAGFAVPEGMERPVLVARRKTDLDDAAREQMTIDAQDSGVARMTPTEIARTSSRAMTAERLGTFRPEAAIGADENRPFLQAVLGALPRSERNAFFDDAGALNAEGRRRVSHAFFARAWDDGGPLGRDALSRYAEAEDPGELRSLMDALEQAAPGWTTLRAEIEAGQVRPEFDITGHVLDALRTIVLARQDAGRAGGSIADAIEAILSQGDLFAGPNPLSVALLRKFWRDGRAAPAAEVARFLQRYADEARTAGRTGDMLGASPADVLRAIDGKTFADLPDEIPPVTPPPAPRIEDAALPETAFAKGADSPEAEAADLQALDDLREATDPPYELENTGRIDDAAHDAIEARLDDNIRSSSLLSPAEQQRLDKSFADNAENSADIDALIRRGMVPAPRDLIVWRGDLTGNFDPSAGPVSYSFSRHTAEKFGRGPRGGDASVVRVVIPRGTPVYAPRSGISGGEILADASLLRSTGPFGPMYRGFDDNPEGAIGKLMAERQGEVPSAVQREDLGDIAFVYGNEALGLRHIEVKHPEMIARLPELLRNGDLIGRLKDRAYIQMPGNPPASAVVRLDWDGKEKTWLVTAFEDERGEIARQLRTSDEPAASASSRIPDATGRTEYSTSAPSVQSGDDPANSIAAARAEFDALGDFTLPDGTRASALLDDIEADRDLLDAVDACMIGGSRT
ncbi:MAG TPA: hypothetical protein VGC77_08690, partial [Rhodopseudomonas sp.]|uniref:putative barnase/colicin E5 family endoribonuclease n=1 Tax=Rhodopseudomonas sp. TaxID=1078 RepID=UPI002ED96FF8